ncbi:MAG: hypothetical protein QM622_11405 [Microbacterium sp.]
MGMGPGRRRADGGGRVLLAGIVLSSSPGEQYEFGRRDERLARIAPRLLTAVENELRARGFRRPVPAGARWRPMSLAVVAFLAALWFGMLAGDGGGAGIVPLVVTVAVAGLLGVVTLLLVDRRPLAAVGAETRDHLLGLKEFMRWAEADRIRMLQSPLGAERMRVDVDDPRQMLAL